MIADYFRKIGWKRVVMMAVGNVFLALGVALFKLSLLGNAAFDGMVMALAALVGIPYAWFLVALNLALFVVELTLGRHFIGIGTLFNSFLNGFIVTFFSWLLPDVPDALWLRLCVMLVGVVVTSLGLSLYQTSDAGLAPYDSLSLILNERLPKIPYFWCRMATDGFCALVCFLAGGIVGVGTLTAAFCLGPIIHFFNRTVSEKLVKSTASAKK